MSAEPEVRHGPSQPRLSSSISLAIRCGVVRCGAMRCGAVRSYPLSFFSIRAIDSLHGTDLANVSHQPLILLCELEPDAV